MFCRHPRLRQCCLLKPSSREEGFRLNAPHPAATPGALSKGAPSRQNPAGALLCGDACMATWTALHSGEAPSQRFGSVCCNDSRITVDRRSVIDTIATGALPTPWHL